MLSIFLIVLVTTVSLVAALWIGTFFFQGYIYTEPSQQLYWQAPAAGVVLGLGYGIWCLWIATSPQASPQNIPVDTIMRFTPKEDMLKEPAPKMYAKRLGQSKSAKERKEEETTLYVRKRIDQTRYDYEEPNLARSKWNNEGIVAIEIEKPDGTKVRFDAVPITSGENVQFRSSDGWIIYQFDNKAPTGEPIRFNTTRLILNILFNVGHLIGWFLVLWVILRFQWSHALGLAIVAWLVVTLSVLPMMLTYSAHIAAQRYGTTTV